MFGVPDLRCFGFRAFAVWARPLPAAGLQTAECQQQGHGGATQLRAGHHQADPRDDGGGEPVRGHQDGAAGPPVGHLSDGRRVQAGPPQQGAVTAARRGAARLRHRHVRGNEVVHTAFTATLETELGCVECAAEGLADSTGAVVRLPYSISTRLMNTRLALSAAAEGQLIMKQGLDFRVGHWSSQ